MSVFKKFNPIVLALFFSVGAHHLQAAWMPPQFFTTGDTGDSPDVGTDAVGNAIAVFVNTGSNGVIEASEFDPDSNTWGGPFQISIAQETGKDAPSIGMSQQNLAYVIQRDQSKPAIEFSQLSQNGWSSGIVYPQSGSLSVPSIAASSTGNLLSSWISSVAGVQGLAISGTTFSVPAVLDSSTTSTTDPVSVTVNNNGTGAAFWLGSNGQIRYSLYNGTSWGQAADATSDTPNRYPSAGVDDKGNVAVVWLYGTRVRAARIVDGNLIQYSNISPDDMVVVSAPLIAVDKSGAALAIWLNQNSSIAFSYFDGQKWSYGLADVADPTSALSLIKDDNKNFLATWSFNVGEVHEIRSSYFNAGLGWSATETVATSSTILKNPAGALSSTNHTAFAVFEAGGSTDAAGTFSLLAIAPSPPAKIQGRVKKDRFPCQTDRIHIISWSDTQDPTAVSYRLRAGTTLLGEFPLTGPFRVDLHNRDRKKEVRYGVSTVNVLGVEGAPVTIELR